MKGTIIFKKKNTFHRFVKFCGMLLLCFVISGCNMTKSAIDNKYRSGVVLILNQYYYTLTLAGLDFYFAGDSNGNIIEFGTGPEYFEKCLITTTGTGFFISNDGKIATNRHVASRTVTDKDAIKWTKTILNSASLYLEMQNDTCELVKKYCIDKIDKATDDTERVKYVLMYNQSEEKIRENNETLRSLKYMDPQDADIEYHSKLYVAYNGTFVKTIEDFYKCSLRKVSDAEDIDLAIIQLNSKETPSNAYIFQVPAKNMLEHYSFGEYLIRLFGNDKNEDLYMIGFNRGFALGITEEGLYSQCTRGSLSQTETKRIQYDISTEPGSSGSPVLNRRGQLVAINFAGLSGTQGFNWGVKEQFLYELMNDQ